MRMETAASIFLLFVYLFIYFKNQKTPKNKRKPTTTKQIKTPKQPQKKKETKKKIPKYQPSKYNQTHKQTTKQEKIPRKKETHYLQ